MTGCLDIGPIRMLLRGAPGERVAYAHPAYRQFFSTSDLSGAFQPLVTLPVDLRRQVSEIPVSEPLWRADLHWALWEEETEWICCVGIHRRNHARYCCRIARDGSRVVLAMDPELAGDDSACFVSPLVYPVDQILSWKLLSQTRGILFHAAVAVHNGMGWVFAGPSGAGKSTLSNLCHAAGDRILNDDRVMVFRRDGVWKVAGTPWHGSGRFAEAAEVPLGGLFLLKQAGSEQIKPVSVSQARMELLNVAAIPWFLDEWSQGILDGLEQLVQDMGCLEFRFTNTPEAVQALRRVQGVESEACR